jgi:hypothetical protein
VLGHPLRVLATPFAALVLLGLILPATPARAAATDDPGLVLTAPATARIGRSVNLRATLQDSAQQSLADVNVHLQRLDHDGQWTTIADSVTTAGGIAEFSVLPVAGTQQVRATSGNDGRPVTSAPITLEGVVVSSTVHLYGSASVVDERTGHLSIRWVGSDGFPVTGRVAVYQHRSGQPWSKLGTTSTDSNGRAYVSIRPRFDTYYQLRGTSGPGWKPATSSTWKVDNRPPLSPVTLPSAAPRPLALTAQRRAVGDGANVVTHLVPDSIWNSMVGKSWHTGCPVGRNSLRYVTVNYFGFDGYRHRGELVVRASLTGKFKVALTKLYNATVPIRSMYLPDRFGKSWSGPGANDVMSMRHDNTSAFNCRAVTGDPGSRSPHSYGGSIDINPWENPFHSHVGWLPNSWWAKKQIGKYAWKTRSSVVVQLMGQAGFRWTYGTTDSQHFDG